MEKRILDKCKRVGACLLWGGAVNSDGYGKIARGTDCNIKLHRYVYEQEFGSIPEGYVVRHSCDNPLCIEPSHLSVGTNTDNMADRRDRGRTHGHVSEEEIETVAWLISGGVMQGDIAQILSISKKRVEYIRTNYINCPQ